MPASSACWHEDEGELIWSSTVEVVRLAMNHKLREASRAFIQSSPPLVWRQALADGDSSHGTGPSMPLGVGSWCLARGT
jgi:hypothetical protein